MPRTSSEAVAVICEVDDEIDLTDFITMANELTTELPASVMKADGVTPYLSDVRLELIERQLAAHFYSMLNPKTTLERIGSAQVNYETNKVDFNLKLTRYGQQAIVLDTTGKLAAYNNSLEKVLMKLPTGMKMQALWLGSDANDE